MNKKGEINLGSTKHLISIFGTSNKMAGLMVQEEATAPRVTRIPALEIEYPTTTPAQNTQSNNFRTITQETMYAVLNVSGMGRELKPCALAQGKFPMEFLQEFANTVLDEETDNILEYWHLIRLPKYKQDWGISFGNEVGRLAQGMLGRVTGTDTMFLSINPKSRPTDGVMSHTVESSA